MTSVNYTYYFRERSGPNSKLFLMAFAASLRRVSFVSTFDSCPVEPPKYEAASPIEPLQASRTSSSACSALGRSALLAPIFCADVHGSRPAHASSLSNDTHCHCCCSFLPKKQSLDSKRGASKLMVVRHEDETKVQTYKTAS